MKAEKKLSKKQIEKTHGNTGDKDESVVYCEGCHTELDPIEAKHGKLCFLCAEFESDNT